jgi:PAS domain S-box-containing protein
MSPDAITITKKDTGKCIEFNNGFMNLFHFSKNEILNKTTLELGIWESEEYRENFFSLMNKTGKIENKEIHLKDKNKKDIYVLISCREFLVDEEKYLLTVAKDITEIKENELMLLESTRNLENFSKELNSKNKDLEEFVYIASHDLQEPLRVVSNYCQLIKEIYEDKFKKHVHKKDIEEIDSYFNYVIEATLRMKYLIRDLLDFSKIGKDNINYEIVDLNEVLKNVLSDFQIKINENKCKITRDKLPKIFIQKTRISQLFHNLISNAIKFKGYAPPRIHLGLEDLGNFWKFYVSDNGIGIDEKNINQIFGLFKRLHTRQEYPGTGIGLSLVKKIVENYGGKIWVESEIGKGSTFYFTLPKGIKNF